MALVSVSHASSSRATAQSCINYDVFLSFRGEDTRDGFTDHLFTTFKQAGIRTFRDDTMERGKLLMPELEKAIRESAISVIVFSEGYASSEWCLDEVLMIVEQHETSSFKHEFIPVFYKVDPSDVRNQRGSFKDAFDAYEDEVNAETDLEKKTRLIEKVEAWRKSLKKVATFTGLVYKAGYESNFILSILNVVIEKVDDKALHIEENLVGVKYHLGYIKRWLQDESPDAVVLLLVGMGGIGKTTIAKCIFNSNFRKYDGSCFLADIDKETLNQTSGLCRLQSQLLFTILKSEKEETIWNVHIGTNKVTNAISNKKLLLVLDDVATCEQINALLGPKRFYPGSKVIITTRHKELLTAFKVRPEVHSIKMLSTVDATELFKLYAFDQDQPIEPFIEQSKLVVDCCKGLPLALKVLGSSLRGKTIDEWEDTLRQLAAYPDPEVQEVLEVTYTTLKRDTDKELFLHIACFFDGEKKDYIVTLLSECDLHPVVGIKTLMNRCLLYVDKEGRVKMHQLIKEMGREVVRKESKKGPGKRSRLWHNQDCINVLQNQTGTKKVEALMLDMREMKEANSTSGSKNCFGKRMRGDDGKFEIGALEKMKNLMLLQLNYVTFSGECKKLPRKLRLLSWHGFSLKSIPADIPLEKLVVLDMSYSKLKCVWDDFKVIGSLKILNLSYCGELTKTPDFHGLPGLESLILKGCLSLWKVDESIGYLKELVSLDLSDCANLREFPCLPTSLVWLEMSGCGGALGRVQSLDSVPSLSFLVELNISNCNLSDSSFPNDWSSFVSLETLYMDGNNVTCLPKCVQTLPRIGWLSVFGCLKLKSVVGLPESLEFFLRNFCPQLYEMEGRYKIRSIDKVERKIIRYLGLESNAGEGMEVLQKIIRGLGLELNPGEGMESGLKVLHEFGIFSTWVADKQIPSVYVYKERGPQISFQVPWHDDGLRISGLNMCVVLSQSNINEYLCLHIEVYNKTKDVAWNYVRGYEEIPNKKVEKYGWLSVWRCGNLLEAGDEILITIIKRARLIIREEPEGAWVLDEDVEECGIIKLIYEVDGETEDVSAFDGISWTDRMDTDISDYVYSASGTHVFSNYHWPSHQIETRIQLSTEVTEPRTKWREFLFRAEEGRLHKG